MAQRLLLAAFCVLIAVQWISSVEGETSCRSRCNSLCHSKKKKHELQVSLTSCHNRCKEQSKNCQKCNLAKKKCSRCLPGFKLISNSRCIPCDTGCRCDETHRCLSCLDGYVMKANGICVACAAGCNCDSTGACVSCQTGYVASVPATGVPQCLACPANCADCSRTGPIECYICNGGFALIDGVCQACISGCLDCKSGLGTCDTCKVGYHKAGSGATATCVACPANCFSCDLLSTTYCDVCIVGYGLLADRKGCVACAPNCKTCNWNGYNSCDSPQCEPTCGYFSGKCQLCNLYGCETCSDAQTCTKCMPGYTLTTTGTCIQSVKCTGKGATITNCAKCTAANTALCEICDLGYAVKSDGTACIMCADDWCVSCTLDSSNHPILCTQCLNGLLPGSASGRDKCWPCKVGCKDCTSTNQSPTTGKCTTCYITGATPKADGTCPISTSSTDTCDPNCAPPYCAKNGKNKCDLNCQPTFVLQTSDHTCQPCQGGSYYCKQCLSAGKTKCDDQQCADGYSLTADNKCSKA